MSHTKIFCAIIFFLFVNNAFNQSLYNGIGHIPTSNQVQWSNAGLLPNTLTYANNIFNVCNYGAIANDGLNDFDAIEAAINGAKVSEGINIVYFPAGTFNINSTINLTTFNERDNIIIQGAGSSATILEFSVGETNCFFISGTFSEPYIVNSNIVKGSNTINVNNFENIFHDNDWVHYYEDNFPFVESDFDNCVGQITKIVQRSANIGTLSDKASKGYSTNYNIKIKKITPITNVGIENLQIRRLDLGNNYDSENIAFKYAVNCWVRGVESNNTCQHHISISWSSHILVSGCYIHEARNYDIRGRGYGVVVQLSSTNCLVQNNIFKKLRHAMLLQGGANCNVFTYNYSREQYWTNNHWPSWITGMGSDLTLHGNYPYANLLEHNWVEKIWADNWDDRQNGPFNAFVRNYVQHDNVMGILTLEDAPSTSVLGCELDFTANQPPLRTSGSTSLSVDLYGVYEEAPDYNYDTGILLDHTDIYENWYFLKSTMHLHDLSYYYSTRPSFLSSSYSFPSIGPEFSLQNIPAKERWNNSIKTYLPDPFTFCPPVISNFTQIPVPIYKGFSGYVYVNLSSSNGTLSYNWISTYQPNYVSISPEGNRCKITYLNVTQIPAEGYSWNFGCNVSNENGSDTKYFTPSLNSDPNGCPTLAFDNRGTLISENPLLITSLSNPGKDVTDYYLINTLLTANNNKIYLTIHEPQKEHTWFDNVSLLETRANPDETLVVNDEGQVINYKGVLPARILLNGETDITQNLLELDSLSVELNPGDKLTISKNAVEGDGDIVINGEVGIPIAKRIPAMLMNVITQKRSSLDGEEIVIEKNPITDFFLRPNKSTISKKLRNLPTGTIEITVNKKLTLDYFVFVADLRTSKTKTLPLVSAVHSINGDIKTILTDIDQNYAELYPTERIDLSFSTNTNSGNRAYILKTVGRYETDTTFVGKQNNLAKINEQPIVPTENKLYDNYPNPFNPSTTINYSLKNDGKVTLKIFNSLGEEIRTLVNDVKSAGNYEVEFNANNLPSGVYIYTIQVNNFFDSKKMILIK